MARRLIWIVLATLAVGAAAAGTSGCGGGGEDRGSAAYADQVNATRADLQRTLDALQSRVAPTGTPAGDERTLRAYEAAVDRALARLRGAQPPASLRALHGQLLAALVQYRAALERARANLRGADGRRALAVRERLLSETAASTARIRAIVKAMGVRMAGA